MSSPRGAGRRHRPVDGRRARLRMARADRTPLPTMGPAATSRPSRRPPSPWSPAWPDWSATAAVQARANGALAAKNGELTAANNRVTRANAALETANARIETRYNVAVQAIRTFHTGVSEDFLLKEGRFKELRDRLLKSASDFYEKLVSLLKDEADLASRRALLQANYEVAELASQVGRREDALALHRRVLAGREALSASPGADESTAVDVAQSLLAVGGTLEETGRTDEAMAAYDRARSAVTAGDGGPPASTAARSAFALSQYRIGRLMSQTGKTAEALAAHEAAMAIRRKLADDHPAVTDFQPRPGRQPHRHRRTSERNGSTRRGAWRLTRPAWRSGGNSPTIIPTSPSSGAFWLRATPPLAHFWGIRGSRPMPWHRMRRAWPSGGNSPRPTLPWPSSRPTCQRPSHNDHRPAAELDGEVGRGPGFAGGGAGDPGEARRGRSLRHRLPEQPGLELQNAIGRAAAAIWGNRPRP